MGSPSGTRAITFMSATETIGMWSSPPALTQSSLPSGVMAMAWVVRPVGIVPITWWVPVSTTLMVPVPMLVANNRRPSRLRKRSWVFWPLASMVATVLRLAPSMTEMVWLSMLAT